MTGYEVSVGTDLLPGLLNGQDGLAKLVEAVLNQVLEAQVTETLGATRHEVQARDSPPALPILYKQLPEDFLPNALNDQSFDLGRSWKTL